MPIIGGILGAVIAAGTIDTSVRIGGSIFLAVIQLLVISVTLIMKEVGKNRKMFNSLQLEH